MTIDWFREGQNETIEKHGNDFYDVHELQTDFGLFSSYMQIRSVKSSDGLYLYKCLARNEFGSSERLIKLLVMGSPERPTQLSVRDVWSRSALVSWSPSQGTTTLPIGSSNGRVSNYTVQYWRKNPASPASTTDNSQQNHRREEIAVDGLLSSALLVNLLPAVSYEVSVIAHNLVGRSEPSETINLTTSEEEPSAPPTDVQVESRGSSTLRVTWKVPPGESLNGKLLGFYIGYRPRLPLAPIGQQQQHLVLPQNTHNPSQQQQQQQQQQHLQQQQSFIYSFKTADAIEGQVYYDSFLTNLKHSQDYEVTVRAFNKAGSGPDCHVVMGRTSSARLLPQAAPNLKVVRIASNSVTLRWSSTNSFAQQLQQQQHNAALEDSRFVLFYQVQGERDWYELTVAANSRSSLEGSVAENTMTMSSQPAGKSLAKLSNANGELLTSAQFSNVHTLSNLQPALSYRIYVASANDYGVGDPSNIVTIKTTASEQSATGAGNFTNQLLLDSDSARQSTILESSSSTVGGGGLLSWWNQQQLYTILSSVALVAVLVTSLVASWLTWQHKLRHRNSSSSSHKFASSSSSSSPHYPSAYVASDTIQSEYSAKRHQQQAPFVAQNCVASGADLEGAYDEVAGSAQCASTGQPLIRRDPQVRSQLPASQQQRQELLRNMQYTASSIRPALSSHYHQPADLSSQSNSCSSGGATLQMHSSSMRNQQQPKSSATLNRNHNRQLPPIPYSTLSVKEIGGKQQQQQWRQQDYRLCGNQAAAIHHHHQVIKKQHRQHQHQSSLTGGSQVPLIYGVIE